MEHFGHKKTAVLPEDVIQRLLLEVSRFWLPFPPPHLEFTPSMLTPNVNSTHNILYFQLTHMLELELHLESKVIRLKQDALRLMNVALAGTTCGQLLTLFEFAFGYPKSQESKERAKQLEELERHFETEEESPDEGDTVSKAQDQQEVVEQFAATSLEPKPKKCKFGKGHNELKDLVPIDHAILIMPSTTVKLSETGVPHQSYSSHAESESQSIYRCPNGRNVYAHLSQASKTLH